MAAFRLGDSVKKRSICTTVGPLDNVWKGQQEQGIGPKTTHEDSMLVLSKWVGRRNIAAGT